MVIFLSDTVTCRLVAFWLIWQISVRIIRHINIGSRTLRNVMFLKQLTCYYYYPESLSSSLIFILPLTECFHIKSKMFALLEDDFMLHFQVLFNLYTVVYRSPLVFLTLATMVIFLCHVYSVPFKTQPNNNYVLLYKNEIGSRSIPV
jgi:hypothetical protein